MSGRIPIANAPSAKRHGAVNKWGGCLRRKEIRGATFRRPHNRAMVADCAKIIPILHLALAMNPNG